MAIINFNANEVEPSKAFDPIPAGKYIAVITDSEMKETRAGTGRYLQLEFEITDGEYAGRKLWARLNIENQNAEAVRMARADLSAICRAVNVLTPNDSADLHNLPLVIKVHCRKDKNTGEITNDIRGYEPKANYRPEPKQAPAAPVSSQGVRVASASPASRRGCDAGRARTAVAAKSQPLLQACGAKSPHQP